MSDRAINTRQPVLYLILCFASFNLGNHFYRYTLWSFRKMREFHGGGSTSRSNRAQGGYISKHFGQRHLGLDHLRATAGVHAFQLAAALVEITHAVRSEEHTSELQ